jgi:hypothetical protein
MPAICTGLDAAAWLVLQWMPQWLGSQHGMFVEEWTGARDALRQWWRRQAEPGCEEKRIQLYTRPSEAGAKNSARTGAGRGAHSGVMPAHPAQER